MKSGKDGVPFKCNECTEINKKDRNCQNRKKITPSVVKWSEFKDRKEEKGLLFEKMGKPQRVHKIPEFTFYECPPLWINPETNRLMDALHIFHEKNIIPVGTSWSEQPLWFAEAYKVYINELSMRSKPENNNYGS